MIDTKVKQLQPNVKEANKEDSGPKELIKRTNIKDSPFEIIDKEGVFFGVMGNYRLTPKTTSFKAVEKELKEITWNRIIQIVMILNEIKDKLNDNNEKKNVGTK